MYSRCLIKTCLLLCVSAVVIYVCCSHHVCLSFVMCEMVICIIILAHIVFYNYCFDSFVNLCIYLLTFMFNLRVKCVMSVLTCMCYVCVSLSCALLVCYVCCYYLCA